MNSVNGVFCGSLFLFISSSIYSAAFRSRKTFFLAREGYWLEKSFQTYVKAKGEQRDSCYLRISRAFMFRILVDNPKSYAYSLKAEHQGTFGELLQKRFLLSEEDTLPLLGKDVLDEIVSLPEGRDRIIELLGNSASKLGLLIEPIRSAYLEYLAQLGITELDELHLVDLGYSGTIQCLLSILLDKPTVGHYLIASNPGTHDICGKQAVMKGYLKEGVKIRDGYVPLDRSMFLEALLTAPDGQFRGLLKNPLEEGRFDFYYGRKVAAQKHFAELEQIMCGALEYVSHCAKHNIEFTAAEVEAILTQYLTKPNMFPRSVHHLFAIDDDVAGNGTVNALQFFGLA